MKNKTRLVQFVIFFLSLILLNRDFAYAQPAPAFCQDTNANADIVVLVDITASNSAANIAEQKNAVLNFIDSFNQPTVTTKPYISVGTFNHNCSLDVNGNLVCTGDAARIIPNGNLTNSYGSLGGAADLVDSVNAITGTGLFGRGLGGTNIAAALEAARQELLLNGSPARPDYVLLISDGNPNLPGFATNPACTSCICTEAEDAGDTATVSLEDPAGTNANIFAIHYKGAGVTCVDESGEPSGAVYMRTEIASNPAFYYNAFANIIDIFKEIAQDLSCQGTGGACGIGFCDTAQAPPICSFIPDTTDSDGDGVPDCADICKGADDAAVGTTCSAGVGACQNSGTNLCSNGAISCNAVASVPGAEICDNIDNNCDGVIDEGNVCCFKFDTDNDGVNDCSDACPGANDSLLNTACSAGVGACFQAGVNICSSGIIRCTAVAAVPDASETCDNIDNNCNGTTDEGSVCCTNTDLTSNMFELDNAAADQLNLLKKELRKLSNVSKSRATRTFVDKTLAEGQKLYTQSWGISWSFPQIATTCSKVSAECVATNSYSAQIAAYSSNADQLYGLIEQTVKRTIKARGRKKNDSKTLALAQAQVKTAETEIAKVPAQTNSCI